MTFPTTTTPPRRHRHPDRRQGLKPAWLWVAGATNPVRGAVQLERARQQWVATRQQVRADARLLHESAWESNPPAQLVTAPTSFED